MPKGRTNPENMPRGRCVCGGPLVAKWANELRRSHVYVCSRCDKPLEECACSHVIDERCPKCDEVIGSHADGVSYRRGREPHVCKK